MFERAVKLSVVLFMCAQMVLIFHFVAKGDLEKPAAPILEYKDFVTILLTCLGVMIAVATVVAAVAAIWGFDLLRRETHAHAESAARASAEKIAHERIEAVLPSLVERAVKFEMQSRSSSDQQDVDVRADEIADEIAKGQ